MTDKEDIKAKIHSYYRTKKEYFDKLDTVFQDRGTTAYKRGDFDLVALAKGRSRILDVGCGSGALLTFLRDIYPEAQYFGVDISPLAIEAATLKGGRHANPITFAVGDAEERIPFDNFKFDLVIAHEVIEHFVHPEAVINNIAASMAKDAVFFLLAPNRLVRSPLRIQLAKLSDYCRMAVDRDYLHPTIIDPPLDIVGGDSDAVYVTNPWELHRMARMAGLQVVKQSHLRCRFIARKP